VEAVRVRTPEEAQEWGFHGSRSVLLDGHDPFAAPDAPVGLAYRNYRTPLSPDGSPSVAQLVEVLARPSRQISVSKRLALSGREC
jgi:hypothetical protein